MSKRKGVEKERFTSYLTKETINEFRSLSADTRIPMASLLEEAVKDLIEKYNVDKYHKE